MKLLGKRPRHIFHYLRARLHVERIVRTLDLQQFQALKEKYDDAASKSEDCNKYLDVKHWMADKLMYLYMLHLDESPARHILDIGCGASYFSYVCAFHDHRVIGLDLDTVPLYNELSAFLGAERRIWRVNRFEGLPNFGLRFDLVTAIGIKFNQHDQPDEWRAAEWEFFLGDLIDHQLAPRGRIFLSFNARKDGSYYDTPVLELFKRLGGSTYHRYVEITTR